MNKFLKVFVFMLIVLVGSGCSGFRHAKQAQLNSIQMNDVVFVDSDLNNTTKLFNDVIRNDVRISVESKGLRSTATGAAEVWVVLQNHTDHQQQVEGRTMFFDASNVPVDASPQWKRIYIPANSLATYKELSISSNVAFYRVELKGAD